MKSTFTDALDATVIKDIPGTTYAYSQFMNIYEVHDLGLPLEGLEDKIIIFDKQTHYVNISTLVGAFGMNDSRKRAANFTRLGQFKEIMDETENEINSLPDSEKDKYRETKAYDTRLGILRAKFEEKSNRYTPNVQGTFVHRNAIIHALLWCNSRLANRINEFICLMFIREGVNNKVTLASEIEKHKQEIASDAIGRNEIISKLTEKSERASTDDIERVLREYLENPDDRYDVNAIAAVLDPSAMKYCAPTRRNRILSSIHKAFIKRVAIVQYFDSDRFPYEPEYDEYEVLVTLHIIYEKDITAFTKLHSKKRFDKKTNDIIYESSVHINGINMLSTVPFTNESLHEHMLNVHTMQCPIREEDGKLIFPSLSRCQQEVLEFAQEYMDMTKYFWHLKYVYEH